jgi:hypothetical protein
MISARNQNFVVKRLLHKSPSRNEMGAQPSRNEMGAPPVSYSSLPNGPQENMSPRGAKIVQYGGPGGSGQKAPIRQMANGVIISSPRSRGGYQKTPQ